MIEFLPANMHADIYGGNVMYTDTDGNWYHTFDEEWAAYIYSHMNMIYRCVS